MTKFNPDDAKKKSFLRLKPISFGKGTENLSREIDDVIYGEKDNDESS